MKLVNSYRILMTADAMGGVWTYVRELAKGIKQFNFEIILAVMGDRPSGYQYDEMNCIGNIKILYEPFRLEWMENPWEDIQKSGEWLLKLQRIYSPDIIHINGYAHVLLPWCKPVVCVAHSCVYSWYKYVKKKLPDNSWVEYKNHVNNALLSADIVIAPSHTMLSDLILLYGEIPCSKVIYNGRTVESYQSEKKEPFILASGRIWDEGKNLKTLCKISKEFKWPLYIAGSGTCKGLNGRHLGFLNESEMLVWFNKASIYLHPALYEPFGFSVLEAAYCDCALILSDIQSLKEIWENAAIFVNPLCTDEIIRQVSFLISNREELFRYAQMSKRKSLTFTTNNMCREYMKTYNNLISNSSNLKKVS